MPATAEKIATHTFYSRGRMEKLVRQPQLDQETALGRRIRLQDAVRYDFAPDGRLTVREGQDPLADGPLDPATGEPTVQDAIAWLTAHDLFNTRFWWEGHEPDRLLPTEEDFVQTLTDASVQLRTEPISELLAEEQATHNRPQLVKMAQRALETIRATNAHLEQQQLDQQGSPPAK